MATIRKPLQRQLLVAWQRTISEHYLNRQINSERSLQASLWSNLVNELPNSRRTFIEPRIYSNRKSEIPRLYPDLLVCDSRNVIAVIELKYSPKILPSYEKDLKTLKWIAANKAKLHVENSRFLGSSTAPERYTFADKVLFVWAGIHRQPASSYKEPDADLFSKSIRVLANSYVQLHAETARTQEPTVFLKSK